MCHVGIQNLTSELTKPTQKTELKSEPPKLRKRPKYVKIHSFFRRCLLDHILDVFSETISITYIKDIFYLVEVTQDVWT